MSINGLNTDAEIVEVHTKLEVEVKALVAARTATYNAELVQPLMDYPGLLRRYAGCHIPALACGESCCCECFRQAPQESLFGAPCGLFLQKLLMSVHGLHIEDCALKLSGVFCGRTPL